jgi:hypothetical protein
MLREIYEYINIKINENTYLMEFRKLSKDLDVLKEKSKLVKVNL